MSNLLLMIKPPRPIACLLDGLRAAYEIDTRYAADKLHSTLLPLGAAHAERISAALSTFAAPSFRVVFDRVEGATLRPSEPVLGLQRFQPRLTAHLARHGLRPIAYRFRPHITLAYGEPLPALALDIDPISWRVTEFLLIESHAGRHTLLERWPLAEVTPPSPARYRDTGCDPLPSRAAPSHEGRGAP